MTTRPIRGTTLAAVAAVWGVMLFGIGDTALGFGEPCSVSGSCRPWWHVNVMSAPASKPGGEDMIVLEVSNLGDAEAEGSVASPITIRDVLPAGVKVDSINEEGGGLSALEVNAGKPQSVTCTAAGVSCAYTGSLRPYERLLVGINVTVASPAAGDALNEVEVSGGGAAPFSFKRALKLEGTPSFGVERYEMSAEEEGGRLDTQAGSHPFQLTTTLQLNTRAVPTFRRTAPEGVEGRTLPEAQPVSLTKDLRFYAPPGLIGNPTALPQCPLAVFMEMATGHGECPARTAVGVDTSVITDIGGQHSYAPFAISRPVYNLEPSVGEPARFGFTLGVQVVPVVLDASVRTGGDYAVTISVSNIPELSAFMGNQLTFWGVPADQRHDGARGLACINAEKPSCPAGEEPRPFLIMPTACTSLVRTSMEADSWDHPGEWTNLTEYTFTNLLEEPLALDGCNRLSFQPRLKVRPDGDAAATPSGLTVDVHVPQDASLNPTGDAESAVKSITVTLPEGVGVNPAGADGLQACSDGLAGFTGLRELDPQDEPGDKTATFAGTLPEPLEPGVDFCPEASKVATVTIHTPLLPHPIVGAAYLAEQDANPFGSLIAMYLIAQDPVSGVLVKLAGEVRLSQTGQITATFDNPPLPFEDAELEFFGGSRAPLGTPALCGSYTTSASFIPWSGQPARSVSSPPFQIRRGPNGAPCNDPLPFGPELTSGSLNIQAGAFTPFTMTMSREDGNQNLKAVQLRMPPGLSGKLSGVELCPEPEASQGLCGPNSLIGETTVSVGLGGNPYSVKGGKVYITGPYEGAPFGLSIVNPAKAGPFDLERGRNACDCVLVRAKVEVDPLTAALTVTSDSTGPYAIPQMIQGIPLQIKHVNVTINRGDFTFNPTNCSKMKIAGGLTSSQDATIGLAVPFQATNCATLRFKPHLTATTSGHTSRHNGASLNVKLAYPKGPWGSQANIAKVKVNLPRQLPSRLSTLQEACPDSTFNADPAACPPASRVGSARATTPVIPVPLAGPAYFVSHGGQKFPELIVVLSGYGVTVQLHGETFIRRSITSSTFPAVPDVPVGTFELKLPQGPNSALAASGNLCTTHALKMPTTFIAQNGMTIHATTPIKPTGCRKRKSHHPRHRKRTRKSG